MVIEQARDPGEPMVPVQRPVETQEEPMFQSEFKGREKNVQIRDSQEGRIHSYLGVESVFIIPFRTLTD